MIRTALVVGTVCFFGGLSASMAQTDQSSAYEHLKQLEWLIGDQVGEYRLPEGRPEFGAAGARVIREVSVRWALNKSVMIADITTRIEGRPAVHSREIASWEPDSERIVHVILGPGENGSGVWSKEGDEWLLKWSVVSADKHSYSGTGRIRTTGPSTSTWQVTDCMKDDQKIADIPVVHFKQRDYSGTPALPENYLKLQERLAGQWSMEGSVSDERVTGAYEYTESPYKQCLDVRATWTDSKGAAACSAILGWDAAKKQMVLTEYWTPGGCNTLCFNPESADVWTGTMAGSDKTGQPTKGNIRLEIKGPNEFIFTATNSMVGAQSQPDSELRFRRR